MSGAERAELARWAHDLLMDLEELSDRVLAVTGELGSDADRAAEASE
jgi:hypothetical protein